MASPYLGEIRLVSFNFAPKGWAQCNGQVMTIQQNTALFAVLGTFYGGNGTTNFNLPDFRGRTAFHQNGGGNTRPPFPIGSQGGEEMHTLTTQEMAAHSHTPMATGTGVNNSSPVNNFWGSNANNPQYSTASINTPMAVNALANNSGSQPHENRAPYLVVNYIIALQGIFPTQG